MFYFNFSFSSALDFSTFIFNITVRARSMSTQKFFSSTLCAFFHFRYFFASFKQKQSHIHVRQKSGNMEKEAARNKKYG